MNFLGRVCVCAGIWRHGEVSGGGKEEGQGCVFYVRNTVKSVALFALLGVMPLAHCIISLGLDFELYCVQIVICAT